MKSNLNGFCFTFYMYLPICSALQRIERINQNFLCTTLIITILQFKDHTFLLTARKSSVHLFLPRYLTLWGSLVLKCHNATDLYNLVNSAEMALVRCCRLQTASVVVAAMTVTCRFRSAVRDLLWSVVEHSGSYTHRSSRHHCWTGSGTSSSSSSLDLLHLYYILLLKQVRQLVFLLFFKIKVIKII